ncbi:MAG: methylated-DNA--[protein]-cysteine S-methyltransferase [Bacillota bacterium]|nr:methylated-DNA--[protein]-cysteine S-methyltransferase [Bacillota bacterium]
MNSFEEIYEVVKNIPKGRVSTYGVIAALTGDPRRSRIVGYAMGACRDKAVPCHRVVYKDGSLSPAFETGTENIQALLLTEEGVTFTDQGKVDMDKFLWP